MRYAGVADIRQEFALQKALTGKWDKHLRILGASFHADKPYFFKEPNYEYIKAEIEWYESQSRNVNDLFDIYGSEVRIWKDVADADGYINSNYGWCIYSADNDFQYKNCLHQLLHDRSTRRGIMIYTRPNIQYEWSVAGMKDFICTNAVQYQISGQNLYVIVQMRSNDAVFGYNNDLAWQQHVADKLMEDYNHACTPGDEVSRYSIRWQVMDFHVYPRHFNYV